MVRAPRSAHIAVAPAPATTSTVTIGPICVTVPIAAPVPEKSAAPNSTSRTLKVKTSNTVNGMDSIRVGTIDTRATNQVCRMNSRQANGRLNIATKVSNAMAKKPPNERTGFANESAVTTAHPAAAPWGPALAGARSTGTHFSQRGGLRDRSQRHHPLISLHPTDLLPALQL